MKAVLTDSDPPSADPARLEAGPPLAPDEVVRLAFLVARRRVDGHTARDIAQETWLKAAAHAKRESDWTAARARAWVRCVAANAALDHLRRERSGPVLLESHEHPDGKLEPVDALEQAEASERERAEARGLLAKLSRADRELLAWRVLEGRSYAELAEHLGLRASSLRARFARLRATLAKGDL
ncbi:MAG: sigma-70 family RNA polymerase sigma factor [Planctomycetes bacterium]|nr:sigma-70 family RNA polymerase sigma factor [Planctomycetota bacterium]